jgi:hypothetical protein
VGRGGGLVAAAALPAAGDEREHGQDDRKSKEKKAHIGDYGG